MPQFTAFVALLLVLAVASADPHAQPPERAKESDLYFPTKVGAKVVFEWPGGTRTETVTAVDTREGTKLVTVTVSRRYDSGLNDEHLYTVRVSAKGLEYVEDTLFERDKPFCLLKLPHKAGATWDEVNKARLKGERSGVEYRATYTVGTVETVKVPAGTFRAIPVERVNTSAITRPKHTIWYAPGVGKVKQISVDWVRTTDTASTTTETVLKSFTPGKD